MEKQYITIISIIGCSVCSRLIEETKEVIEDTNYILNVRGPTLTERQVFGSWPVTILPNNTIIGGGAIDYIKEWLKIEHEI